MGDTSKVAGQFNSNPYYYYIPTHTASYGCYCSHPSSLERAYAAAKMLVDKKLVETKGVRGFLELVDELKQVL